MEELIRERWVRVSQEFINFQLDKMSDRLRDVNNSHGDMTRYEL